MPREIEARPATLRNWTFRLRPGKDGPGRLLIMLHGWTGDENSMWVFVRNLPAEYTILAPRAPFVAPQGGYSWRSAVPDTWSLPSVDDLRPAVSALLAFIDAWAADSSLDATVFDVMGFSQGAALTLTLALLFPWRVRSLAVLSGFLPLGAEALLTGRPLAGKPVFVAHGTDDDLIPVERTRNSVTVLKESGAQVVYCEAEIGHKVSAECLKGIESFFRTPYNSIGNRQE